MRKAVRRFEELRILSCSESETILYGGTEGHLLNSLPKKTKLFVLATSLFDMS